MLNNFIKYKYIFFAFLWFFSIKIFAQKIDKSSLSNSLKEAGIPVIQNYLSDDNHDLVAPSQLTQHPNGLIYATSKKGIVEFDGSRWQLIYENRGIHFLCISDSGQIFITSSRDFGVLKQNAIGEYYFESFKERLGLKQDDLGLDAGCFTTEKYIYFVFAKGVFEWSEEKITSYKPKNYFISAFVHEDKLYLKESFPGLFCLKNGRIRLLKSTEELPTKVGINGLVFGKSILLGSNLGKFYRYQNDSLGSYFLKLPEGTDLNTVKPFISLGQQYFALGTQNKGILIYAYNGELLSVINKSCGLPINRINGLFVDDQEGLWATHDNGVSRIEIFSPFSFYDERSGIDGHLLNVFRLGDTLYATSLNSLYKMKVSGNTVSSNLKFSRTQRFDFTIYPYVYKDMILLASSKGLFGYYQNHLFQLTDVPCSIAIPMSNFDNIILVAEEYGVKVLKDMRGELNDPRFAQVGQIKLSENPVTISNFIQSGNQIWVAIDFKDIYFIEITSISDFNYEIEKIKPPVENASHIIMSEIGKETGFLINGELFTFNEFTRNFEKHAADRLIDQIDFIPYMVSQRDSLSGIVLSSGLQGQTVMASLDTDEMFDFKPDIFTRYPDFRVWNIYPDQNDVFWFAGVGGLVRFDYKRYKAPGKMVVVPLIREVRINGDSLIFSGVGTVDKHRIDYTDNSIKLKFALPYYNDTRSNRFKYILEGLDEKWSSWTYETQKDYTNLFEGNYTFRVISENIYGQISNEASYSFTILPPWYRTWWAYLFYGTSASFCVWLLLQWRSRQLRSKNVMLEKLVNDRTMEIREKNKQLEIQTTKLRELDGMKTRLFANISHEFRTPLTLIKGPIEKLEISGKSELSIRNIKMIRRSTDRLLKLVNQLLDLSKIDSGGLRPELTEGDIFKCARAAASSFSSHAAQRKIDYQIKIHSGLLWASFDRDKLEKIIYNLLSNAFKFTPDDGLIIISVDHENNELRITVYDTGCGIKLDQLPYVFNRFFQVDDSFTKEKEGSGIGLSLTKELVELMDGRIYAESEYGKGSTFKVIIPLEEIQSNNSIKAKYENNIVSDEGFMEVSLTEVTKADKKILVVEDNLDMRHFIKEQLLSDYCILEAGNGKDGMQMASELIPDLIVTDLMMPQMDGITLCKKLKTTLGTSHIPVIMLTAKAGTENVIEGLETGADSYLTKPFNARELKVRVKNLIEERRKLRELYGKNIAINPKEITVTSVDQRFLEKVLELLEERYADTGFGVPAMQESLAMGKTQLHHKVKALTNYGPGELIRNFRLNRAAQILSGQGDSVTQVAYAVGFNNLSYFAKCFRELHGRSPSDFLSDHKK